MPSVEVHEVIAARAANQSKPGSRTDNHKVGLVIEGGGMRGVVSAGMVSAIEQLGLLHCFDAVYGSSAGSINGAFLLAGLARYGTTVYYQNINNLNFINPIRGLHGKPILSLEYLLDYVFDQQKILPWHRVVESEIPLVVVASSVLKGEAVYFRDFKNKEDLRECLRASARIPIIAGPPVRHRGDELWDALIFETIPILAAANDNCTHALCLLTRPTGHSRSDLSWFETAVVAQLIGTRCANAKKSYIERASRYNDIVRQISLGNVTISGHELRTAACQISGDAQVIKGTEKNEKRLIGGATSGFIAAYKSFGRAEPQIVQTLNAFQHKIS